MKYATNEFWTGYPTKKPLPWKSFCGSFEELKTQLEEKWKNYDSWSSGEDDYFVATTDGHYYKILHVYCCNKFEGLVNNFYWQKCLKEHTMQILMVENIGFEPIWNSDCKSDDHPKQAHSPKYYLYN